MQITNIDFHHLKPASGKLQAFVTITINDCLVISDIRIFSSKRGVFVSMPSRKMNDGNFKEIVFAISTTFRDYLSQTILRAFSDEVASPEF